MEWSFKREERTLAHTLQSTAGSATPGVYYGCHILGIVNMSGRQRPLITCCLTESHGKPS
jgi:hypothetical protein